MGKRHYVGVITDLVTPIQPPTSPAVTAVKTSYAGPDARHELEQVEAALRAFRANMPSVNRRTFSGLWIKSQAMKRSRRVRINHP